MNLYKYKLYKYKYCRMLVSENALGITLCDEKEGTSCSQGEADIARQLINARKVKFFHVLTLFKLLQTVYAA